MSKLEEVSSKPLVLVDSSEARKNHLLMFLFSLIIGIVYSAFLWLVCSTTPGVLSALLLFVSQIAMGFPATRAYYDIGMSNRENLHFIDPAKFNGFRKHHRLEITLGEISPIFEKIDVRILNYDKGSLDDLNDIAWFVIFVWAGLSSTSFFIGFGGYPLCLIGTIVFLIASFVSYLSGYRTRRDFGFEEDLSHLQYYVEKHLREINTRLSKNGMRNFVHLLERRRAIVLVDFTSEIKHGDSYLLEYHMGFPSTESERIVIKAGFDDLFRILRIINEVPAIAQNYWFPEMIESSSGSTIQIINQKANFSVNNRASFVSSPSRIDESSQITAVIYSEVLASIIRGGLS